MLLLKMAWSCVSESCKTPKRQNPCSENWKERLVAYSMQRQKHFQPPFWSTNKWTIVGGKVIIHIFIFCLFFGLWRKAWTRLFVSLFWCLDYMVLSHKHPVCICSLHTYTCESMCMLTSHGLSYPFPSWLKDYKDKIGMRPMWLFLKCMYLFSLS